MLVTENVKDLIQEYEYEIQPLTSQFLSLIKIGAKIKIKEKISEELLSSLLSKLNCRFGTPVYFHSYYGFIWKNSNTYVAYNLVEEYYGYDSLNIYLFDKIPFGKKLKYDKYCAIDGAIGQVFAEHGFKNNSIFSYSSMGFSYIVSSADMQWLLQLKRTTMYCYFSKIIPVEPGLHKIAPHCMCKKAVNLNNIQTIKMAMEQSYSMCLNKIKSQ